MRTAKTTFYDLLERSVISQLLLTIIVVGGTILVYIMRGEVPQFLEYGSLLIMGFFFGSRVTNAMSGMKGNNGRDSFTSRSSAHLSGQHQTTE